MNANFDMKDRKDFLLKMYETLNKEIERHINSIWQVMGVILSTFAIFALVEKKVLPLDLATCIILIMCGLGGMYALEANFWYNRNLVIIANIERQFLLEEDQKDIHYYFVSHRENNALLKMVETQLGFIGLIGFVVALQHFVSRVYPGFSEPISNFNILIALPYLITLFCVGWLLRFASKRKKDYNDFVSKSPGIEIKDLVGAYSDDHKAARPKSVAP